MADELSCATVDERDLVEKYVAGRLDEDEALRFEAHWFGCESCWSKVQIASKVRGATVQSSRGILADRTSAAPRFSTRFAVWATAAALILATGGIWLARRQNPNVDIERSAGSLENVRITRTATVVAVEWSPVAGAARYHVEVSGADGRLISTRDVDTARIEFDASGIPVGASLVVEARSALGDRLGNSSSVSLKQP